MANHPNRSKITRYDNVMSYNLVGTYKHNRPDAVVNGESEYRGKYDLVWSKDRGFLVYFQTGTPNPLVVNKDAEGYWLETKDYQSTPESARTKFRPDDGELERIGAV